MDQNSSSVQCIIGVSRYVRAPVNHKYLLISLTSNTFSKD